MIALGSDHAGDELKRHIMQHFDELGIEYKDLGFYELKRDDDYPVVAKKVARAVQSGEADKGMLFCGTGIGMSLCANTFKGVRAVVASDMFSVRHSRLHNDANILCFGARVMARGLAIDLCDLFLKTDFEGGRHAVRVAMFEEDLD
ncbi:MAG: ribose 5-phosphate isomerase B [Clostridia bacterium]|nr:ribose 5-phosphate isomerase B [Clostridia bacterium]